jgi:hypothetical protein
MPNAKAYSCDRTMAANMTRQPRISLTDMLCPRISQPEMALKTLSRLMTRLASEGFTPS